jgi:outer membrane protein assembly factor BamA
MTLALAASASIAQTAFAQDEPGAETGEVSPAPGDRGSRKPQVIFAPVPFSSPASGTGLAAGAVAFYNPNDTPHQWITGGGVVWTSRGTRGVAAFHKMASARDRFRLNATASYLDQESHFFGIGAEAGDLGEAITLQDKQVNLKATATWRVFANGFLGLRYQLGTHDARPDEDPDEPPSPTPPPSADQRDSTLSVVGPAFTFDTTDSHTQPRRGVEIDAVWTFGFGALGDSYDHDKLVVEGHAYFSLSPRTVLAASAQVCSAHGEVAYYDLCLFGASADLRGYETGRYRDRASWALQAEVRRQFGTRWGGVAFAGIGGIAPSAGDLFDEGNVLPAGGVGLRYRPFRSNDVQLRVDFAFGKNDRGVYVGIGEAF